MVNKIYYGHLQGAELELGYYNAIDVTREHGIRSVRITSRIRMGLRDRRAGDTSLHMVEVHHTSCNGWTDVWVSFPDDENKATHILVLAPSEKNVSSTSPGDFVLYNPNGHWSTPSHMASKFIVRCGYNRCDKKFTDFSGVVPSVLHLWQFASVSSRDLEYILSKRGFSPVIKCESEVLTGGYMGWSDELNRNYSLVVFNLELGGNYITDDVSVEISRNIMFKKFTRVFLRGLN